MNQTFIFILTSFFVAFLIFSFSSFLNLRLTYSKEKASAYECGFDAKTSSRVPFSMQFFLISILFLIFDVEIILISPLPFLSYLSMATYPMMMSNLIIFILSLGLLHEWNEGSLTWLN
uniref:NADH-ubiquinone oxidoreductase chain 3 n=1 Tax=Siboglinum plumosum TaxID=3080496 RepID=A0AA97AK86_9ANNE|nr:NADH dehydrogenase subunit 3 [Siboglinum plumosum]WNZ34610.1 NADH dehydrogenase subunit 3 [Siboglinum plumosum]